MSRGKLVISIGFFLCAVVVGAFVLIIQRGVHVSFAIRTALELPRDTAWMLSAARPVDAVTQFGRLLGPFRWEQVTEITGIPWGDAAALEQIGIEPSAYVALAALDVSRSEFVLSVGLTKQAQSIPYLKHTLSARLNIPEDALEETTLGRWPALWITQPDRTWALMVRESRCLVFFSSVDTPDMKEKLRAVADAVDKTKEKFSLADVPMFRRSVEQKRSPVVYVYASHQAVGALWDVVLPGSELTLDKDTAVVWAIAEDPTTTLFHTFRWYGGESAQWRSWFGADSVLRQRTSAPPVSTADAHVRTQFRTDDVVVNSLKNQMVTMLTRLGLTSGALDAAQQLPDWVRQWDGELVWYWARPGEAGVSPAWWLGLGQTESADIQQGRPANGAMPVFHGGMAWWTNVAHWADGLTDTAVKESPSAEIDQGPISGAANLRALVENYFPNADMMTHYGSIQLTSRVQTDFLEWTVVASPSPVTL